MLKKIFYFITVLLIVAVSAMTVKSNSKPQEYEGQPYIVERGDVLWNIVNENAVIFKGEDVTSMCRIISDYNELASYIQPGQVIYIPVEKG